MNQKLWIRYPLPGLNDIIGSARTHWAKSAKEKKVHTDRVIWTAKSLNPIKQADFIFTWIEKNRKRDPDNITAGQKFIFDGLIGAGVLENDGWSQVKSITHRFEVGQPAGVMVEMIAT